MCICEEDEEVPVGFPFLLTRYFSEWNQLWLTRVEMAVASVHQRISDMERNRCIKALLVWSGISRNSRKNRIKAFLLKGLLALRRLRRSVMAWKFILLSHSLVRIDAPKPLRYVRMRPIGSVTSGEQSV